jgi:hypothetical protein
MADLGFESIDGMAWVQYAPMLEALRFENLGPALELDLELNRG